jgi:hypothetical protein
MAKKEAVLEYRLSRPDSFHCSLCGHRQDEGAFVASGDVKDLLDSFSNHVASYHPTGEDFSQAAARIVREATEDK